MVHATYRKSYCKVVLRNIIGIIIYYTHDCVMRRSGFIHFGLEPSSIKGSGRLFLLKIQFSKHAVDTCGEKINQTKYLEVRDYWEIIDIRSYPKRITTLIQRVYK